MRSVLLWDFTRRKILKEQRPHLQSGRSRKSRVESSFGFRLSFILMLCKRFKVSEMIHQATQTSWFSYCLMLCSKALLVKSKVSGWSKKCSHTYCKGSTVSITPDPEIGFPAMLCLVLCSIWRRISGHCLILRHGPFSSYIIHH